MIRQVLESTYRRTVGTLKDGAVGLLSSLAKRGSVITAIYVLALVSLMAGFVTAIVYPVPNQTYIPYPNGQAETIPEAVVDAFVIFMGGAHPALHFFFPGQVILMQSLQGRLRPET